MNTAKNLFGTKRWIDMVSVEFTEYNLKSLFSVEQRPE